MNRNTKTGLGMSFAGMIVLIFHLLHLAHTASSIGDSNKTGVFKNAVVHIIQTDSLGKTDTMLMNDYLEKQKR